MPAKRLTDLQRDQIRARFLAGETQAEIARAIGCSASSVTKAVAAAGLTVADRIGAGARGHGPASTAPPAEPDAVAAYRALGAPQKADALDSVAWLQKVLIESAHQVATDDDYHGGEIARRRELREVARSIVACTPQSLLAEVRRLIKGDADELKGRKGPEREDVPAVERRVYRASASRGRPRKF